MQNILRVDVSSQAAPTVRCVAPGEYAGLGGRALTSAVVSREVPADCHPLGPENRLVLAPGLLSGTAALCARRLSVGCKSPLTGTIMEAGAPGNAAHILARLGYAAIVLEGQAPDDACYILRIARDGVAIVHDESARMLTNYELMDRFLPEYGRTGAMISIGTAGEMRLAAASIALSDGRGRPTSHAARGGVGAVMGAKGVKAILIDGAGVPKIAPVDPDGFKAANMALAHALRAHPLTAQGLPAFGTGILTNSINEAGAFPGCNFRHRQFAGAPDISGESLSERLRQYGGRPALACCPGCPVRCSGIINDAEGAFLTKRPAYDTLWAHGANCGINDVEAIARLDRLDDDYGLDPVETGVSIAIAMEAGLLPFGDSQGAIELVHQIGNGTPLGRILGAGAETAARVLGIARVPVVKGQALAACDPRVMTVLGASSATSPTGPEHAAWSLLATDALARDNDAGPADDGPAALSRRLLHRAAVIDTLGLCRFAALALLDGPAAFRPAVELLNACHGWTKTRDELHDSGYALLAEERAFNVRAGFTAQDDQLPRFFALEPLPPHQVAVEVSARVLHAHGELTLTLSPRAVLRFCRFLHHGFLTTVPAGISVNALLRDVLPIDLARAGIQAVFLNSRPVEDADAARVGQDSVLALSGLSIRPDCRRDDGLRAPEQEMPADQATDSEGPRTGSAQVHVLVKLFDLLQDRLGPHLLRGDILVPCDRLAAFLDRLEPDFWRDCGPITVNGRVTDPSLYQIRLPQTPAPVLLRVRSWPDDGPLPMPAFANG